ncbi:helix-turn-helix domain-containing protein [Maribacter sp. 4U21]|uniref:helix-turn-helix domain-containing protein n=1 Tax=Maribacter sp. 4U21 TaxID=1889779 RepID=UPI0011803093|nr:AraC family transcriptional regulator [Maribacter sp. 4U21]
MEGKIEFISSLGKISFFLMVLFSIFLITVKTKRRLPNYLLATMLLLVAFDLTGFFAWKWMSGSDVLVILKTASSLLQMPLFFLYLVSVCYANFKLRPAHLLHGVVCLLFIFIFSLTNISERSVFWFEITGELQWAVYMLACFRELFRYEKIHQENHSFPNSKAYKWLFQFAVISTIAHSLVTFRWLFSAFNWEIAVLNLNIGISISILLITAWFVFKALHNPDLFTGVATKLRPLKAKIKSGDALHQDDFNQKKKEKLLIYMEQEKPYLDYDLTLQKLAFQIDIIDKELSILINHHIGQHFFDFVNEYRVNEAKRLLGNPDKKALTILEILYQVGFNSKSSFYTAFKKITGKTPVLYRKERLQQESPTKK